MQFLSYLGIYFESKNSQYDLLSHFSSIILASQLSIQLFTENPSFQKLLNQPPEELSRLLHAGEEDGFFYLDLTLPESRDL
jgi:hypothetical protein